MQILYMVFGCERTCLKLVYLWISRRKNKRNKNKGNGITSFEERKIHPMNTNPAILPINIHPLQARVDIVTKMFVCLWVRAKSKHGRAPTVCLHWLCAYFDPRRFFFSFFVLTCRETMFLPTKPARQYLFPSVDSPLYARVRLHHVHAHTQTQATKSIKNGFRMQFFWNWFRVSMGLASI